jgi:amino acid adenylation domain-containing protein
MIESMKHRRQNNNNFLVYHQSKDMFMNKLYESAKENSQVQGNIQSRCFHPKGIFVEFKKGELERNIFERFEEQVGKYREQIAVKTKDQALTYHALNQMANGVAQTIRSRFGDMNEPIALLLEQNGKSIAAILGVLKAGKFYVPLDPAYPRARLTAILQDCQTRLILTDSVNMSLAKDLSSPLCSVLCLDQLATFFSTQSPALSISPDTIAAIFYTSGSTGQPKGVIQTHRNILHRVMIDTNNFHICPDDRLSLLSSPTYSVSLRNLFGALLNGASVCPFNIEGEGVAHLADWLTRERITIYFSVPTVFRHFTENLTGAEDLSTVRLIYLAGEGAVKRDVELYKKYFAPECIFVNSLASNEAGIIRQYFVDKKTEIEGTQVMAGYKVEDKEILLLDDTRHEVAPGEVGEIAVRSGYLSAGYWQKPDLTATVFLSVSERRDQRVYLTGDLGRMLSDGCLVYLGRKDTRVKIRGIGIEVGEIETVLLEHGAVKEAIVMPRGDVGDEKRLVAYVVGAQEVPPTSGELRTFVRQKLPESMVPSRFVFLKSLPLTINGKVDRQSLALVDCTGVESAAPFLTPRNPVETILTDIWRDVLGLEKIGINDNFFDLGGHSLLATQVIARLENIWHLDLPLATVLVNPTIAAMAEAVIQYRQEQENE